MRNAIFSIAWYKYIRLVVLANIFSFNYLKWISIEAFFSFCYILKTKILKIFHIIKCLKNSNFTSRYSNRRHTPGTWTSITSIWTKGIRTNSKRSGSYIRSCKSSYSHKRWSHEYCPPHEDKRFGRYTAVCCSQQYMRWPTKCI